MGVVGVDPSPLVVLLRVAWDHKATEEELAIFRLVGLVGVVEVEVRVELVQQAEIGLVWETVELV